MIKNISELSLFYKIMFSSGVILLVILLYSYFIGTRGLLIKNYEIKNNKIPDNFHGIKIIHFSDFHYGFYKGKKELEKIIKEVNKLKPDIIIFTGDLIDKGAKLTSKDVEILTNYLSKLEANLGKFAVTGNHDLVHQSYESIMNDSDFIMLDNKETFIYNNNFEKIRIAGIEYLNENPNLEFLNNTEQDNIYTIVLTHAPDIIIKLNTQNIDLMLAGHSHGGQVKIPFLTKLFLPNGSKEYYKNYYKVNNTDLYISSGIGTSVLNLRLFNRPSINLYRLIKK
jgi:predicted MPP superfamily phosphohydrolase